MIKIRKGMTLPIAGEPDQVIESSPHVRTAAIVGTDYVGLKPSMKVKVGDQVRIGDTLFINKKAPAVRVTAPVCGKVVAINRGEKRVLESVVIAISGQDYVSFPTVAEGQINHTTESTLRETLINSGMWTAFRTRPFSHVPDPFSSPEALFINVMDTNPLALDPNVVLRTESRWFSIGVRLLTRLTKGPTFVCKAPDTQVPHIDHEKVKIESFDGPHPAGLVGTHIHHLAPVSQKRTVWHIGYQDVIAIGKLFINGVLDNQRVVAIAGPAVKSPCLVKAPVGACLTELTSGMLQPGNNRIVSGSLFSGHTAKGHYDFLGRYHTQVSVLEEGVKRELLGWQAPGFDKFSVQSIFASKMMPWKKFRFDTNKNGSLRALVTIGSFEKVMPLDIEPAFLMRALLSGDTQRAQDLGLLELDEEDVALCTYVCPSKVEYGPMLRTLLNHIEQEG